MISDAMIEMASGLFATLGLPGRSRILWILQSAKTPLSVGEIAEASGQSIPNCSKHLSALTGIGVVSREKVGRFAFYRVQESLVPDMFRIASRHVSRRNEAAFRELNLS